MDVLIVLVFVCLVLVTAAVLLFIMRVRGGDFEHGERLSLLPLDDEGGDGTQAAGRSGDVASGEGTEAVAGRPDRSAAAPTAAGT